MVFGLFADVLVAHAGSSECMEALDGNTSGLMKRGNRWLISFGRCVVCSL